MYNLLEKECGRGIDGDPGRNQPGWPGIDHQEVAEMINQIPDGSWKLPDVPFAKYNAKRMVDFLTRAYHGFGYAHLAARGIKTGELRAVESYIYFSKVMPYAGPFEEKESIIISTLNGMQALADGGNQQVTEADILNTKVFLISYAKFGSEYRKPASDK
jgi:hypothetical protein